MHGNPKDKPNIVHYEYEQQTTASCELDFKSVWYNY